MERPGDEGGEVVEAANPLNGVFDEHRRPRRPKLFATAIEVVRGRELESASAPDEDNPVTAEEILAKAKADGVDVALTATGDDLELLSAGDPPPDIVALLKDAKTEIISRLQMERRMINHWVADTLIDWPQDSCLKCRNRVLVGQAWTDVTNGDARARFHRDCEPVWRAEREALARKTIGLFPSLNLQPE